jgi:hypothetical protein
VKIYSDKLGDAGIRAALARTPDPVYLERFEPVENPRIRAHGWDILLGRTGSARSFNSGTRGAKGEGAASWDDWGRFLAELFELDPDAEIPSAKYHGLASFHASTHWAYQTGPEVRGPYPGSPAPAWPWRQP